MAKPLVALLTDFGTRDHYAGVLKGVILTICADVTLIDVSHDLPAHDVAAAALELSASYKYFPPATIFLVVVDPGVGSARRGLAAEVGDYRFVAPDNGVLTCVLQSMPSRKVVELTERRYARPTVSRTFEGRDRFAPAAAWLAKGVHLSALGRPVSDYHMLDLPVPTIDNGVLHGRVTRIDRFGNVITNLDRKACEKFVDAPSGAEVIVGGRTVTHFVSTFADLAVGEIGALFGSTDHLECAVQSASAAEQLGAKVGDAVDLKRRT